jgi:co-chaperonin GroES (HSP10)
METKESKLLLQQKQSQLSLKQLGSGMKIKQVFGNRCLVKTVTPHTILDEYQKLGLSIPNKEEHTPRPSTGIVIQLGDQWQNPFLEVGAMVFFSKFAGADFVIEEEDFRVLDYQEILCEVEPLEGVAIE